MDPSSDGELAPVKAFYRSLLEAEETDDRRAVGWKTEDIELRQHASVSEVFRDRTDRFEVYEVGCGLGAYARFLERAAPQARYRGCDLIPEMVEGARRRVPDAHFEVRDVATDPPHMADYVVASGTFNSSGGLPEERWTAIVEHYLRAMYSFARAGIAVTFLTDRVDWKRQLGVYRDPLAIARFAEIELSRFVELRCGYHPWEFTLHVLRAPRALAFGPPAVAWPPPSRERPDAGTW